MVGKLSTTKLTARARHLFYSDIVSNPDNWSDMLIFGVTETVINRENLLNSIIYRCDHGVEGQNVKYLLE